VFILGDHGLVTGGEVQLRAESGGTLPAPLVANTAYFAIVFDEHRFSLAATLEDADTGAAIDLTTAGSRVMTVPRLPMAAAILFASRMIEDNLPAHVIPQEGDTIHDYLRITCAEIAAGKLGRYTGSESRSLTKIVDDAMKRLARWASGIALRGPDAPAKANLAAGSASQPLRDARGWSRFGGL
jgi:hypothetical protein